MSHIRVGEYLETSFGLLAPEMVDYYARGQAWSQSVKGRWPQASSWGMECHGHMQIPIQIPKSYLLS